MLNIAVAGLGEVGRYLISVFQEQGHNIVAVDQDAASVQRVEELYDIQTLVGNVTHMNTLGQLEPASLDLFIAVTESDTTNLLSAVMAKNLGVGKTVCRVAHRDLIDNPTGYLHNFMGVDLVINPDLLAARQAENFIRTTSAQFVTSLADNQIMFVVFELTADAAVTDKLIRDLKMPPDTVIAGLVRDHELIRPAGTDLLISGDRVLLFCRSSQFNAVEKLFSPDRTSVNTRVTILGAGDIGLYLARSQDEAGFAQTTLIESDREVCEAMSGQLKSVTVLNGDSTRLEFLMEEHIGDSDLFVATTRNDEVNLLSCLLARDLGVKRTASMVHKPDYAKIFEKLGIDYPISPRMFAAKEIVRFIRAVEISHTVPVENGKAEIIEMVAVENSRITQNTIRELTLPRGTQIVAAKSGDKVYFPQADDVIYPNSQVIIFTEPANRRYVESLSRKRLFSYGS